MGAPALSLWPSKSEYNTGRAYRNPFTGETLPSVTTVLKQADRSGLVQWAVGLTLDWANLNWSLLGTRSDSDAKRAGQYQWNKVRDERAEVGTGVHEAVESVHTGSPMPFLDEEQEQIMERFHEFQFLHEVEPVLTEFTVWSEGRVAGTADGLWRVDGKLLLIDVKTSKNTWPEHYAQLAALATAEKALIRVPEGTENAAEHTGTRNEKSWWIEVPNPALEADGCAILHLRADKQELITVDNIDLHKEVFDGYLMVHQAKEKLQLAAKSASIIKNKEETF